MMKEIEVISSLDGSVEKNLVWVPPGADTVPLVVGLHTWSYDRFNQLETMLPLCKEMGWALLLPEFRGSNLVSNSRVHSACGSAVARQDIYDAVAAVSAAYPIDTASLFCIGGSGGGHMALLCAAQQPARWRAVAAWAPITDLGRWYHENERYRPHLRACCGGAPGESPAIEATYRYRSPIEYIDKLSSVRLSVHHGRHDATVSYHHTMSLVSALEKRGAEQFFFEIFDGDHLLRAEVSFRWFQSLIDKNTEAGLTG